jgi:hypothetical protein
LDAGSIESAVDTMFANTIQTVTNGQRGPDQCFAKKLSAIGKKAQKFRSAGTGLHQPARERTVRRLAVESVRGGVSQALFGVSAPGA